MTNKKSFQRGLYLFSFPPPLIKVELCLHCQCRLPYSTVTYNPHLPEFSEKIYIHFMLTKNLYVDVSLSLDYLKFIL